jgi:predicted transcriptional regulator of viral defense system
VTAQGAVFVLQKIAAKRLFGLKTLWRGSAKVAISDPARTLIDMISAPETGGGIDHVAECLRTYLGSKIGDRDLIVRYAEQLGNGAVFKRLGFLADTQLNDKKLADACRARLTQGYARLDPALSSSNLVTAWRLWVPTRWKDNVA